MGKNKLIKRVCLSLLTAVLVLSGLSMRSEAAGNTDTLNLQYGQTEARTMLEEINNLRNGNGGANAWYWNEDNTAKIYAKNLGDLQYDYDLEKVAMLRAVEIAYSFSHTRPNGQSCFSAYTELDYHYGAAGENIAAGYMTADSVQIGWEEENELYNGQGHRRNLLSEDFKAVGIGHVYYNGRHYWVQEFSGIVNNANYIAPNDSTASVTIDIGQNQPRNVTPANENPNNENPNNENPNNETPSGENPNNEQPQNRFPDVKLDDGSNMESFEYEDICTGKIEKFDVNNGKATLLIMGNIGNCYNTDSTLKCISEIASETDMSGIDVYYIDGNHNDSDYIKQCLNDCGVDDSFHVSSMDSDIASKGAYNFYLIGYYTYMCIEDNLFNRNYWPNVLFINKNGEIIACTNGTSSESKDEIKQRIIELNGKKQETPKDDTKVSDFVERLYNDCLERPSEAAGKASWVQKLCDGEMDGATVGSGFVFSEEYINKGTTKKEYLTMLYKVFMGRTPDNGGMEYWLNNMKNGMTREEVFKGFVESPEYTQICADYGIIRGNYTVRGIPDPVVKNGVVTPEITAFVERIYGKALDRESDPQGIQYWSQEIANEAKDPVQVAELFIISEEFEKKKLNDVDYVKVLYRTFMGREYDDGGLKYWLERLQNGDTRKTVLEDFASCPEFQKIIESFGL